MKTLDDSEEWRPVAIPEYAEIYEVSSHGRVRRAKENRGMGGYKPIGQFLKPWRSSQGRLAISLSAKNKVRKIFLHHLVLGAFVGPRPKGMEGCHGDGNSQNNHLSNLRWDTHASNQNDMARHGSVKGERNGGAKLNESTVIEIRNRHANGSSLDELRIAFGISKANACLIVNRKAWRHVA